MKKYSKNEKIFLNNFGIHVQFMRFNFEPIHTHDFFEFVYMLKGSMINKVNGQKIKLDEGSLIFIDYEQTHEIYSEESDISYINILVTKEFLNKGTYRINNLMDLFSFVAIQENKKRLNNDYPIIKFEGEERKRVEDIIYAMLEEYNSNKEYAENILYHYFYILIMELLRSSNDSEKESTVYDINEKIKAVLEYLDKNYNKEINLKEVAERFFYNTSYFSRLFKKICGRSFKEYVQDLRIKKSIVLMAETDYTIEKIVEMVGYLDKKQFYSVFKKRIGSTPAKYRRDILTKSTYKE